MRKSLKLIPSAIALAGLANAAAVQAQPVVQPEVNAASSHLFSLQIIASQAPKTDGTTSP